MWHCSGFFQTALHWLYNSCRKFLHFYIQYILKSRTGFLRWNVKYEIMQCIFRENSSKDFFFKLMYDITLFWIVLYRCWIVLYWYTGFYKIFFLKLTWFKYGIIFFTHSLLFISYLEALIVYLYAFLIFWTLFQSTTLAPSIR